MKYLGLDEENCDLYISQIKHDKNNKYDPYLNIKVPFRYNKYEIELKNKENDNFSTSNDTNYISEELNKLNDLLKSGVITQEEFEKAKKKILDD